MNTKTLNKENNTKLKNTQDKSEEIDCNYTRVTEVLYPFSGLANIDPEIVANAGRRGTRVHDICEAIVSGIGYFDLDDEVKGYVRSFEKWWADQKVLCVEKRFYCSELLITGKVDMIIESDIGPIILDLKTSYKPSKTWALQGSAYAYMAKKYGFDIQGIHFLHLSRNGIQPHLYVYDDQFDMFKKCLDVFRFFDMKI